MSTVEVIVNVSITRSTDIKTISYRDGRRDGSTVWFNARDTLYLILYHNDTETDRAPLEQRHFSGTTADDPGANRRHLIRFPANDARMPENRRWPNRCNSRCSPTGPP
jgi:hypothetical protein